MLKEKGFTLIELLVVIAIVAILAAILFPVFAKAREKARQTKCLSNARQIIVAVQMYAQDNGETYFPHPGSKSWASFLAPYNEATIYDCPSTSRKGSSSAPDYGFNPYVLGATTTEMAEPASAVVIADLRTSSDVSKSTYLLGSLNTDIDPRHNKGAVIACADGHTQYEPLDGVTDVVATLMERDLDPFAGSRPVIKEKRAYVALGGEDRWHTSQYYATLPEGCYRKDASDPMAECIFEWEQSRSKLQTGGCEFNWSALGMWLSDADMQYHGPSASGGPSNSTSGWYAGMRTYASPAAPYDGHYTNLFAEGKHWFAGGSTSNIAARDDPGATNKIPIYATMYDKWYSYKAIFVDGKCTLTVKDPDGKVLGVKTYTVDLANDQAPGNNKVAALVYVRNGKGYCKVRNLTITNLNSAAQ